MPLPHFLRQPVQPQQLQPVEVDPTLVPIQQAPVPTEPQTSFFGRLAGNTLSGLAAVGNFLDVPGSMVRDVATFRNPLDQLLTPFSDANRTTGRQMLADYGLTTENDPNRWELADFAGFGAELGADPFFWPAKWLKPFGMAADAAKGASVGGELLRAGYRATPEAFRQGVTRATQPATTFMKGLFSYPHMGQFTPEGQAAAESISTAIDQFNPAMQADRAEVGRAFQSAADMFDDTVRQDALQQLRDQPIDIDITDIRERARELYDQSSAEYQQMFGDEGMAAIRDARFRMGSTARSAVSQGLDETAVPGFDLWADELRGSYPQFEHMSNEDLLQELAGRTDDPPLFRQSMQQAERELTDEIANSRVQGGDEFELEAGRAVDIRNPRLARVIEDTSELREGLDEFPEMTTGFLSRIGTRSSKVLVKKKDPYGRMADQLRYVEVPNEQLFRNIDEAVQVQQAQNFFDKFQSDVARFGGEVVDNPPVIRGVDSVRIADTDIADQVGSVVRSITPDDLGREYVITDDSSLKELIASYVGADGDTTLPQRFPEAFNQLASAKLEREIPEIFRGLNVDDIPQAGESIDAPGFSWTTNEGAAVYYGDGPSETNVVLRMANPKRGTDLTDLDDFNSEVIWSGPLQVESVETRNIVPDAFDLDGNRITEPVPVTVVNVSSSAQPVQSDAYVEAFMKFGDLNVRETSEEFAQRNANVIQALRDITEMRPMEGAGDTIQYVGSRVAEIKDALNRDIANLGGNTGFHTAAEGSATHHWPRYVPGKIAQELQKNGFAPSDFVTAFESMKMRRADIRDLPTATVEELLSNTRYRGQGAEQRILEDFGSQLNETFGVAQDAADDLDNLFDPAILDDVAEAAGEGLEAHAASLAEFVKQHNRGTLYQHTLKADMDRYIQGAYRTKAGLTGLHNYLSSRAALNAAEEGTVPLSKIYNQLKLNTDQVRNFYQSEFNMNLDELRVPREVADTATRFRSIMNPQRIDGPVAQVLDKFNRWFKSGVTLPFPAFHARNFLSGQVVNFMFNDTNPKEYLASFNEAIDIARNVDNLTDEQLKFVEEAYTHGVIDEGYVGFGLDDTIHPHNEHIPEASRLIPGTNPYQSRAEAAAEVSAAGVPSWINWLSNKSPRAAEYANRYTEPLRVLGQQVMGTGGNAGRVAEYFNRMPLYITLRKQGMDAAEAAAKVEKLHFNYAKLTPFEKDVAKRAIPFWTFSRKMSELVVDDLIKNPGGKLAQTIRATRLSQQDDPATPEYVSQTTSIPIGRLDDGTASYITGFGMAHEDPLSFIGADRESGMLSPQTSILELLSRTSPLIKAPLELATGESFFQKGPMGGRELIDMDPTLGRLASNVSEIAGQGPIEDAAGRAYPVGGNFVEHLVANSPYARFASTARAVTDPRKYQGGLFPGSKALLNTFTGLRVSDVSPEAQQAVIRERASAYARENMGAKMYQKVYFSKDQIANTEQENPELASQMKLINRMQQLFKKKKEEKVESNPE